MKKSPFLPAFLAIFLFMSNVFAEEADPVIVSVDDVSYRLHEVQDYLDAYAKTYQTQGGALTQEEASLLTESVLQSYVDRAVLDNKIHELGLDIMTDEETENLAAQALAAYEQIVADAAEQVAASYQTTPEAARPVAVATLEMNGITSESILTQARAQWQEQRLLAHVASDIDSVEEAEILEAYQAYYVDPCMQAYAYDIAAYENNTVLLGDPSYYIPEGYRLVREIYLPFPDTVEGRIADAAAALDTAYENAAQAESRLEKVAAANGDTADAQSAFDEACLMYYEKENLYTALKRAALTESATALDAITAELEAGEDIDAVIGTHSQKEDSLIAVHTASILFEDEFTKAAMALEAPGDISAPIATADGLHILYYDSDQPGGKVPLSDALRAEIEELLIIQARYRVLETFLPAWRTEYEIYADGSLLQPPV